MPLTVSAALVDTTLIIVHTPVHDASAIVHRASMLPGALSVFNLITSTPLTYVLFALLTAFLAHLQLAFAVLLDTTLAVQGACHAQEDAIPVSTHPIATAVSPATIKTQARA